jgi:hypothetical protein
VQAAAELSAGQVVTLDHIADIVAVDLGVTIPSDCGVYFMFSWRWKRGLFFGYSPFHPKLGPRGGDLEAILGACFCALVFAERFSLTEDEWKKMFNSPA